MAQITTRSIRKEFEQSTNQERVRFADAHDMAIPDVQHTIRKIEDFGERIFRNTSDVETLRKSSRATREDNIILSFREFSSSLQTQGLSPVESAVGGELAARQLAQEASVQRDNAITLMDQSRGSVTRSMAKQSKRAENALNQKVDRAKDPMLEGGGGASDPLKQEWEYMFYDAFALIKGPDEVKIIDFNNDIISANVTLSTDISPGNFAISFVNDMEQYVDDYGVYAFKTGDTIRIFATKRFDDGGDRYAHVFWGIIERVADEYSNGQATINLSGQDISAWLQYTTIRANPTLIELQMSPSLGVATYGHKYANKTVIEILADIIFNDVEDFNAWTAYSLAEVSAAKKRAAPAQAIIDDETGRYSAEEKAAAKQEKKDIDQIEFGSNQTVVEWWKTLFLNELVVKVFAYDGVVAKIDTQNAGTAAQQAGTALSGEYTRGDGQKVKRENLAMNGQSKCNALRVLDKYVPIRMFASSPIPGVVQLEDTPKLEIIRQITEGTLFEFFMDRDGALVFKPPFYQLLTHTCGADHYFDKLPSAFLEHFDSSWAHL